LPFESYQKALTPGLVHSMFVANGKLSAAEASATLTVDGGYVQVAGDAGWWVPSGRVFFHPDPNVTPEQELSRARQHFFLSRRFRDPFQNETRFSYDAYDIAGLETEDAMHNKTTAGERDIAGNVEPRIDYRLLLPTLVTDFNGNRSAVAFDVLGLVAGTSVMGKSGEDLGDSLQDFMPDLNQAEIDAFIANPRAVAVALLGTATMRIVYDAARYFRTGDPTLPSFSAIIAREQHVSDLAPAEVSPLQIGLGYSDGFGREIQRKREAEPGPLEDDGSTVTPRWIASGWTIFDNKANPVRRYEPFFSASHGFQFAHMVGASSILFYDPLGRPVSVLYPNHTYDKTVHDPWRQETWDANDTVTLDPLSDQDIFPFFMRLPPAEFHPTWFDLRTQDAFVSQAQQRWPEPTQRDAEREAAMQAAAHLGTPTIAHLDVLGRSFLSIADNAAAGKYLSRINRDIEGNARITRDALGRTVTVCDYDMLGNRVHQASMEAGKCWILNDAINNPMLAWDDRNRGYRTGYDALRRPIASLFREGGGVERVVGRTVYGEIGATPEAKNLRGRVMQVFDQAGADAVSDYDFKGNALRRERTLAANYRAVVD
jgi:hypothetical protein